MSVPVDKPLRLKSEKVGTRHRVTASTQYVNIVVDTGVAHLTNPYTYAVPDNMALEIGHLVEVPFNNLQRKGFVLGPAAEITKAKFVSKQVSTQRFFTESQLHLFERVVKRYGSSLWDTMRLAIPPATKSNTHFIENPINSAKNLGHYAWTLELGVDRFDFLRTLIAQLNRKKVVLVLPNERDVAQFAGEFQVLSSKQSKSERFISYLESNFNAKVVVGMRTSSFLDIPPGGHLIVLDDGDPAHHELHQPTFNSRDVALLRAQELNLHFVSTFHSAEVARLIQSGWLKENRVRSKKKFVIQSDPSNEKVQQRIRDSVKVGRVLMPTTTKSYRLGIACKACRSRASCECGGNIIESKKGLYECNLCRRDVVNWQCASCGSREVVTWSRGGGLQAEELARSITSTHILHITSENIELDIPHKGVVLATSGLEPQVSFKMIAVTNAEKLLSFPMLRADELAMLRWRNAFSLLEDGGTISVSLPSDSLFVRSLVKNDWWILMNQILSLRLEVSMPPYVRIACVNGDKPDLDLIAKTLEENEVVYKESERILVKIEIDRADQVVDSLRSAAHLLSLKRSHHVRLDIDPFIFN